jgi:DNA-binding winged helix-turn-helix (wHTH) protein
VGRHRGWRRRPHARDFGAERLFEDDPKQPHVIETIPKAGYRLVAELAAAIADTRTMFERKGPA